MQNRQGFSRIALGHLPTQHVQLLGLHHHVEGAEAVGDFLMRCRIDSLQLFRNRRETPLGFRLLQRAFLVSARRLRLLPLLLGSLVLLIEVSLLTYAVLLASFGGLLPRLG